jgi:hypothetical protein
MEPFPRLLGTANVMVLEIEKVSGFQIPFKSGGMGKIHYYLLYVMEKR